MYRIQSDVGEVNTNTYNAMVDEAVDNTFILQSSKIPHELLHETGTILSFNLSLDVCKLLIMEMVKYEMKSYVRPEVAMDISVVYDPVTVSNKDAQGEVVSHIVPLHKLYVSIDFASGNADVMDMADMVDNNGDKSEVVNLCL